MNLKIKSRQINFIDRPFTLPTILLDVWLINKEDMSEFYIEHDLNEHGGKYGAIFKKVILLVLKTGNQVWINIKPYSKESYSKYVENIGDDIFLDIRQH